MNHNVIDHRSSDGEVPTNIWLLRNPLDFIAEDHFRLRLMCAQMQKLTEAETPDRRTLAELSEYLENELPMLLADEEEELMPRVLRRAEPEDEIPRLAERLRKEHDQIVALIQEVTDGLAALGKTAALPEALRAAMHQLIAITRRHVILENAVLLPLARARLTVRDLKDLQLGMLRRRGLDDLFST